MDTTENLRLPFILPSQAQKHVTHNDALAILDAAVQIAVVSRAFAEPPGEAGAADRFIVADAAFGAWAGHDGDIAFLHSGDWRFVSPNIGWLAWCVAEAAMLIRTETGWEPLANQNTGASARYEQVGIATEPDPDTPLAVQGANVLFNHGGADCRLTVNKAIETDTASIVFQQGFSGRGEIGLCGGEQLVIKVSPDGSEFRNAVTIEPVNGKVSFPHSSVLTDCAFNLFADSGRFAGADVTGITAAGFAFPGSFQTINGASVTGHSKFVYDNNDHGGAAGWLSPETLDLITKIRQPGYRRYGVEFWIAQVTQGAGTAGSLTTGGETFYECLFNTQRVRLAAMTFHGYLRALDQAIAIRLFAGQKAFRDGVETAGPVRIEPADGWVSLAIADSMPPDVSYGYTPATLDVYCKSSGDRWLFAAPVLTPGIARIQPDIGVVASILGW